MASADCRMRGPFTGEDHAGCRDERARARWGGQGAGGTGALRRTTGEPMGRPTKRATGASIPGGACR
jgi:hypothetical protein